MQKAYELSEKIVSEVNYHVDNFKNNEFKTVSSEDMVASLDKIVKDGAVLYKYLQENKFYEGIPTVTATMIELAKVFDKLQVTEKNAKKLDLKNSMQYWDKAMIIIAVLACNLLDHRDNLN